MVTQTGFEPAISSLKVKRLNPLANWVITLVQPVGFEPTLCRRLKVGCISSLPRLQNLVRPVGIEPTHISLKRRVLSRFSYGRMYSNQPCSLAVFRRWQLAQRISHLAISLSMVFQQNACAAICETSERFVPRTWSNSKTIGSCSLQSTHG